MNLFANSDDCSRPPTTEVEGPGEAFEVFQKVSQSVPRAHSDSESHSKPTWTDPGVEEPQARHSRASQNKEKT